MDLGCCTVLCEGRARGGGGGRNHGTPYNAKHPLQYQESKIVVAEERTGANLVTTSMDLEKEKL